MATSPVPERTINYSGMFADVNQLQDQVDEIKSGELTAGEADTLDGYHATSFALSSHSHKNYIINGDMRIAQRGANHTDSGAYSDAYTIDMFKYCRTELGGYTMINQNTSVVPDGFSYSLEVDVYTADTSIGSSDYYTIQTRLDPKDVNQLLDKTCTLSFWVRSSKTGAHSVYFHDTTNFYVEEYTITTADTWEYKTITLDCDYEPGYIGFVLACGSSYMTSTGVWKSSKYLASSNQVNLLDSTSNYFYLTGVQLNIGDTAIEYCYNDYAYELNRCQRFFEKSYSYSNAPGTSTQKGCVRSIAISGDYLSQKTYYFKTSKADENPTIKIYSTTGNLGYARDDTADGNISIESVTSNYRSDTSFEIDYNSELTAGHDYWFHWTAEVADYL